MRRCQKHGSNRAALITRINQRLRRKKARVAFPLYKKCAQVSKMSCSGPILLLYANRSAKLQPRAILSEARIPSVILWQDLREVCLISRLGSRPGASGGREGGFAAASVCWD